MGTRRQVGRAGTPAVGMPQHIRQSSTGGLIEWASGPTSADFAHAIRPAPQQARAQMAAMQETQPEQDDIEHDSSNDEADSPHQQRAGSAEGWADWGISDPQNVDFSAIPPEALAYLDDLVKGHASPTGQPSHIYNGHPHEAMQLDYDGSQRAADQAVQREVESTYASWANSSSASARPAPRRQVEVPETRGKKRKSSTLDENPNEAFIQQRLNKLDQFRQQTGTPKATEGRSREGTPGPSQAVSNNARRSTASAVIPHGVQRLPRHGGFGPVLPAFSNPLHPHAPAGPAPAFPQPAQLAVAARSIPPDAPADPKAPVSPHCAEARTAGQISTWSPKTVKRAHVVQSWITTDLLTSNMFPTTGEATVLAEQRWQDAQRDGKLQPVFKWKPWLADGLTAQMSNLRHRFKGHIKTLVHLHYGLGSMPADQAKAEATKLLTGYVFHYPHLDLVKPATSTAQGTATQQQTPQYKPRGRALSHPAVIAVILYVALEDRKKHSIQPIIQQAPHKFEHELPVELYAYALTMIEHILDCIKDDDARELKSRKYKAVYQRWIATIPSLGGQRGAAKMAELRAEHLAAFKAGCGLPTAAIQLDSLDTDDEGDVETATTRT